VARSSPCRYVEDVPCRLWDCHARPRQVPTRRSRPRRPLPRRRSSVGRTLAIRRGNLPSSARDAREQRPPSTDGYSLGCAPRQPGRPLDRAFSKVRSFRHRRCSGSTRSSSRSPAHGGRRVSCIGLARSESAALPVSGYIAKCAAERVLRQARIHSASGLSFRASDMACSSGTVMRCGAGRVVIENSACLALLSCQLNTATGS